MSTIKITWVYEPFESLRFSLGRDRRFVDQIGRFANGEIPLFEGNLAEVLPPTGFILLNTSDAGSALALCDERERRSIASRLVPIDASRSRIYARTLHAYEVAAAVDAFSHLEWSKAVPGTRGARGPYGLRRIAEQVGAGCEAGDGMRGVEESDYCYLTSDRHEGLPHLLADYLMRLHEERERERSLAEQLLRPSR